LSSEGFQFSYDAFEFGDEAVGARAENVEDGAVIPQGAIAASGEAVEYGLSMEAEVGDDGAGIVKFVRRGDEARVIVGVGEMGEVVEFALLPRRLGLGIGVGAAFDDAGDAITETLADLGEHRVTAAVFDDVVEESGNGLVFIAPGFEDERRHGHEMGNVRYAGFFAGLGGVLFGGKDEGFVEASCEMRSPHGSSWPRHTQASVPKRGANLRHRRQLKPSDKGAL
jgi:hypothetical protein